jgi:hypothetical protein
VGARSRPDACGPAPEPGNLQCVKSLAITTQPGPGPAPVANKVDRAACAACRGCTGSSTAAAAAPEGLKAAGCNGGCEASCGQVWDELRPPCGLLIVIGSYWEPMRSQVVQQPGVLLSRNQKAPAEHGQG